MGLRAFLLLLFLALLARAGSAQAPAPDSEELRRGLTRIDVTVVNANGAKLPGINVTGSHQGTFKTRDPDYRAVTNADGVATLWVQTGRYGTERFLGTTIWLEASEPREGKVNVLRTKWVSLSLNYRQLLSSATILMLPAEVSDDPEFGVAVRIRVVDQDDKAIPDALVSLQTTDRPRAIERLTDANGLALMEATVMGDRTRMTVEVSKADHKPVRRDFTLSSALRRTGEVTEKGFKLVRLGAAEPKTRVTVNVRALRSNLGVPDAHVRLAPQAGVPGSPAAGTTDPEGNVVLTGGAAGLWTVEVRHSQFDRHQEAVELSGADQTLEVRVRPRVAATEDSKIDLTVLAADRQRPDGQFEPIPRARVIQGNSSSGTDDNGKVTIGFQSQIGVDLRIEADGYEPQSVSISGGRYLMLNHQRTVRLLPKDAAAQEDSRVELTVLAADPQRRDGSFEPIAGARVSSPRASALTDALGKARIDYSGLVGVELRVEAEGYAPGTLRITGGAGLLPNQRRELRLQPVPVAARDDSELELLVLGAAAPGAAARPQPIAGARISRGASGSSTDAQGKARFGFVGQAGIELRVEAEGYRPGSVSVPAARVAAGGPVVLHRRELQLQPDLADESTPIQLRMRIAEVGSGDRVGAARVKLAAFGRVLGEATSDANGLATLRLDGAAMNSARNGLSFEVEAKGYRLGHGTIAAHRLVPSKEPVEQDVTLDPLLVFTVRVLDNVGEGRPIANAGVSLYHGAQALQREPGRTDALGQIKVELVGKVVRPALREGLFVEVKADGFVDHRSTIAAALLGGAAPLYLVQVVALSAGDLPALAAEVTRLEALRRRVVADTTQFSELAAKAQSAATDARNRFNQWLAALTGSAGRAALAGRSDPREAGMHQAAAVCAATLKGLEAIERDAARDAAEVVRQIQNGRNLAQACQASPSAGAVTQLEQAWRRASQLLTGLDAQLRREKERNANAKQAVQGAERSLSSPGYTQLKKTIAEAEQAAQSAAGMLGELKRQRTELQTGHAAAATRLERLRGNLRSNDDYGRVALLKARIDRLPVDALDVDGVSRRASEELRKLDPELQAAQRAVEGFLGAECKRTVEQFQRVVDGMDADFSAADATFRVNNLSLRLDECRANLARASQPPALVAVPDLAGMPQAAMAQAVRNAGLSWGGAVAAGRASSAALAGKLASQQPRAFERVAPGTPVLAYIWQDPLPAPPPPVVPTLPTVPSAPTNLATVPTLAGLPSRLAMDVAIIASGLTPAYQAVSPPMPNSAGQFAGQDPAPGTQLPRGSIVRYGIYELAPGLPPTTPPAVVAPPPPPVATGGVPSVIGDSLARAQAKLEAVGLRVGGITLGDRPPSADLAGRIYHQDPPAGSRLQRGSGVALRQYGPFGAGPGPVAPPTIPVTPPGPPVTAQGNCATNEGPIGCTGSFAGNVSLSCTGVAPGNYPATMSLRANGSTELQIASPGGKPYVVAGTMDRSGQVLVNKTENGERHQWNGQFSRQALPGGGGRLAGAGRYEATIVLSDARTMRCSGNFTLL